MPALALVTAFVVGALVILVTSGRLETVGEAYWGLLRGAFIKQRGFSESLVATMPYVFLSLGLALGFKAGLFNIGVEGQFYMGAIAAAWVGQAVQGVPAHHPSAVDHSGGRAGRRDLGGHPRLSQGQNRRARGHQHHDDELHRLSPDRVPHQRAVARPGAASTIQTPRISPGAELWSLWDVPARLADPLNALGIALARGLRGVDDRALADG